jgi:hypothetical protein
MSAWEEELGKFGGVLLILTVGQSGDPGVFSSVRSRVWPRMCQGPFRCWGCEQVAVAI